MHLKLDHDSRRCNGTLRITGSKSETNRLLLLQALFRGFEIENVSNSDDSKVMQEALTTSLPSSWEKYAVKKRIAVPA